MKKIYIAHPLLGDMDRNNPNIKTVFDNMNLSDRICRNLVASRNDILILSPIHMFSFFNPFERKHVMACCLEVLLLADELWVFGNWQSSEGCKAEIVLANERGIPVLFKDGCDIN